MSLLLVLAVIAVAQVIFVILLTGFVIFRRERVLRRMKRVRAGRAELATPLAHWLVGSGSVHRVADGLRALPPSAALAFASELYDTRVPRELRAEFGHALRGAPWANRAIAGATSWRWWRRLDAARALGIVGTLADGETLRALIEDEHPAVRLAAMQALSAVDHPDLIRIAVSRYPQETLAVRLFISSTLRTVWRLAEAPLCACLLAPDSAPGDLAAWLALAESLNLPSLRLPITALAAHSDPEVRAAAARALRRYPHADSVEAARRLLDDEQDFVRAAGAQALGVLRAAEAQPQLEHGLSDRAWWVRFRSALALALLGEAGRASLRRARQSPDRFAAEMAQMTSGLSEGTVLEMADA